jgi:PAS domain S-box-containing protein
MLNWVRSCLAPPVFQDEAKTQLAAWLNAIVLILLLIENVGILLVVAFGEIAGLLIILGGTVCHIVLLLALHRGYVRAVSIVLVVELWASVTVAGYAAYGVESGVISAYFLILPIAALLLDENSVFTFAGLSVLALWGLYCAFPPLPNSFGKTVTLSLMLGATAIVLRFTVRRLHQALDQARRGEQTLAASNRELEAALEALRESEAKFRHIIEAIPMGMHLYALEPGGRLVFSGANPAADRILGLDNARFVGKTIEEAFPALTETESPERYRLAASQGTAWKTDQITYEENGIASAFEVHAFQTSPGKMVAAFLDITDRKRAEAQVLRLQHLLQNITDSMPSALIALNPAGLVLNWNPAAEAITGRLAEHVLGQLLWQVCPELERYRDAFEQAMHAGQVVHRSKEQLGVQGSTIYCDVDVFPLVANHIEGAALRIDDVTRRVQMEEAMLQSAKLASVGGLAAGVAHEINNPLAAMMQSAQMVQLVLDVDRSNTQEYLRRYGIAPDELRRYLEQRGVPAYLDGIRGAGARAAKIVSDLLSFSRKSVSDAEPHDLNTLVEQTLALAMTDYDLRKRYDFRSIEIARELAPNLPRVICDGQQIQQVVLNLVRNAAQAMRQQMETASRDGEGVWKPRLVLRTSLRQELENNWARLEVEDNGPGIPEAIRARLFEPFLTTKPVDEGTGLGLWLCWSIVVERHGGRIWAEPVAEGGIRFVIDLPRLELDQDQDRPREKSG